MASSSAASSRFQCITLTLLILPVITLLLYLATSFPSAPAGITIHPSLSSLVSSNIVDSGDTAEVVRNRVNRIYPENLFDGGDAGYVNLPYGRTRYWLLGPEGGQRIVLIHGLSIPSLIWKQVAPELARRGFRVLLYDLYGRGYSEAPQTTYSISLYVTQLALLMQYVGWDRANIAGLSMGGGIAAAFNVQFPHLVSGKVALIASAGIIDSGDMSRTSRLLSSPLVQIVTSSYPFRMYLKHLANSNTSSSAHDPFSELIRIQSAHLPGYNLAIASSIREGPVRGLAPVYVALGRQTKKRRKEGGDDAGKVLVIWGTRDTVVPYHYAARVHTLLGGSSSHQHSSAFPLDSYEDDARKLTHQTPMDTTNENKGGTRQGVHRHETDTVSHVQLVTIEGAKHDLTASHPGVIVELLSEFFDGTTKKAINIHDET